MESVFPPKQGVELTSRCGARSTHDATRVRSRPRPHRRADRRQLRQRHYGPVADHHRIAAGGDRKYKTELSPATRGFIELDGNLGQPARGPQKERAAHCASRVAAVVCGVWCAVPRAQPKSARRTKPKNRQTREEGGEDGSLPSSSPCVSCRGVARRSRRASGVVEGGVDGEWWGGAIQASVVFSTLQSAAFFVRRPHSGHLGFACAA